MSPIQWLWWVRRRWDRKMISASDVVSRPCMVLVSRPSFDRKCPVLFSVLVSLSPLDWTVGHLTSVIFTHWTTQCTHYLLCVPCILRSATYDFLLTFHSNHGSISYRFRDKRQFPWKSQTFLTPSLKEFPLELGTGAWSQKTRMMALPDGERSLTISSAVWIQYTNVTDRRTDTGRQ